VTAEVTVGHDDVDASGTATSLVTAEVTVDEAMLSTHGERRQQHSTQERYAKSWQGPATGTEAATTTAFATVTVMASWRG